jgi:hypothetical protein
VATYFAARAQPSRISGARLPHCQWMTLTHISFSRSSGFKKFLVQTACFLQALVERRVAPCQVPAQPLEAFHLNVIHANPADEIAQRPLRHGRGRHQAQHRRAGEGRHQCSGRHIRSQFPCRGQVTGRQASTSAQAVNAGSAVAWDYFPRHFRYSMLATISHKIFGRDMPMRLAR